MRCKTGDSRHDGNLSSKNLGRERTMANDPFNSFEVPTQMRQLAEQSLEQARKAVDGFMTPGAEGRHDGGSADECRSVQRQGHGPEGDGIRRAEHRKLV